MAKKQELTVSEAAEFAGLSERTIQDYCQKGIIDAYKDKQQWHIWRTEFKQWIRTRKVRNV